jgi:hypothetical protein
VTNHSETCVPIGTLAAVAEQSTSISVSSLYVPIALLRKYSSPKPTVQPKSQYLLSKRPKLAPIGYNIEEG